MKQIAIFYHALFALEDANPQPHQGNCSMIATRAYKTLPSAVNIVHRQMVQLIGSGLANAASEIQVGINGGEESKKFVEAYIPPKAQVTYHGLPSRAENLTIVMIENWVKTHPNWNVLYFHSKGASHEAGTPYANASDAWREGMMQDLVSGWRQCVQDLETHDIACSHWMWDMGWDKSQHIPAGNFLWVTSNFAAKLPSLYFRERIKQDGIAAVTSRYESEVYWGNGPRPNVKQYRPNGGGGVP